jgi:hypothetical protein
MAVLLSRSYKGLLAGNTVSLSTDEETNLIAQNMATTATLANITTGAYTNNSNSGVVAIAAGASSVVITNSLVDANSKIYAVVDQAAADGTLLRVERIVPAAGSFTIYGTANATATTLIAWAILLPYGETIRN